MAAHSSGECEVTSTSYGWYRSAARVVLLGHGADEQHAGYGRHRTSFRNQVSLLLHLCLLVRTACNTTGLHSAVLSVQHCHSDTGQYWLE